MVILKAGGSQVLKGPGCWAKEFGLHSGDRRELQRLSEHSQGLLTKERHLEPGCRVLEGCPIYYPARRGGAEARVVPVGMQRMKGIMD